MKLHERVLNQILNGENNDTFVKVKNKPHLRFDSFEVSMVSPGLMRASFFFGGKPMFYIDGLAPNFAAGETLNVSGLIGAVEVSIQ